MRARAKTVKVMESRIMAAWHLRKCLLYATFEEISELTGVNRSTLISIRYGACDSVPHGTTKTFRELVEKLKPRGELQKDEHIPFDAPDVQAEVARLRQTDRRVHKIRRDMAEKAMQKKEK